MLLQLSEMRPEAAKRAELERREHAEKSERPLLTKRDVEDCEEGSEFCSKAGSMFGGDISSWGPEGDKSLWDQLDEFWASLKKGSEHVAWRSMFYLMQKGFSFIFPYLNFVQGFPEPGFWWKFKNFWKSLVGIRDPKWRAPVKGERLGLVTYQDYAKHHFGETFPYDFFKDYYTGNRVPSWEDASYHNKAIAMLDAGVASGRALGIEPMDLYKPLEPRMALDNEALIALGWTGFEYLEAHDIKYASNGVWGVALVEKLVEKYGSVGGEVLGPLMTDSVFSVHLRAHGDRFKVDMSALEKYRPIEGFAALGGKAEFKEERGSLHMTRLEYKGKVYTNFTDAKVADDYKKSTRSGWRYAEGALIASLLSMTNLVLHVKDLHLELAAAFQAITVDAFADDPTHPLRRVLDPFIHRSVQATNDNFKLLFNYHAAEFSLAPLPFDEQLRLIDDFIKDQPLNLADMDMENFGKLRGMKPEYSTKEAVEDPARWGWRWHHRSLDVQRLYEELLDCRLSGHYGTVHQDQEITDSAVVRWYNDMVSHMPALKRATQHNPEWAEASKVTFASLKRVLRVLLVWLSWIHEDVGHSAASYVYNPVYTPMNIPEDGVGVPMRSYVFNTAAYRGFVFLERSVLTDEPPDFWFETQCSGFWIFQSCGVPADDPGLVCFKDFQASLEAKGREDAAFRDCDKTGFYSCVDRIETAVSS